MNRFKTILEPETSRLEPRHLESAQLEPLNLALAQTLKRTHLETEHTSERGAR